MHRLIFGLNPGDRVEIDHINHDGLDNRRTNLRMASHAENHQNRRSSYRSTSRYRGVHWNTASRKWRAVAKLNGREFHIGYFTDEEEAARCVAAWRAEHMPFAVEASA